MAYHKVAILFMFFLFLHLGNYGVLGGDRTYTFEELWGGDITLSAFPWGVKNLLANITISANETIIVKIYSNGDITLTLRAGKKNKREVIGNNETLELTVDEDISNISLNMVNTNEYPITIFKNSTIRIKPPSTIEKQKPIIGREEAKIYGALIFIFPILIMIYRSATRKKLEANEKILEYLGVEG